MASILYTGTWGSDDATRATMPFLAALGAVEAGHQAQIMLLGEATYLMHDYIVDQIDGVGVLTRPLRDHPAQIGRSAPQIRCRCWVFARSVGIRKQTHQIAIVKIGVVALITCLLGFVILAKCHSNPARGFDPDP